MYLQETVFIVIGLILWPLIGIAYYLFKIRPEREEMM